MAVEHTTHDDARHITGDYYFLDEIARWKWFAAAFLSITLPPVGIFFVTWFFVSCIRSEERLDDPR